MKMRHRVIFAGLAASSAFFLTAFPSQSADDMHAHPTAPSDTEDPLLKEQISKITKALDHFHHQMAEKRKAVEAASDPARKTALGAELKALHRDHDILEKLLHDLVNEATATEQTKVDEALQRIKRLEERQELEYRQEEIVRDRQDQERQEQE